MIYVLLIYTCILTLISFVASHKDITSPSFYFAEHSPLPLHGLRHLPKVGLCHAFEYIFGNCGRHDRVCYCFSDRQLWMKKIRDDKTIKKCKELTYIEVETWKNGWYLSSKLLLVSQQS